MGQTTALLVVDMQMEMAKRAAAGRPRANPDAEDKIAALISTFRVAGLPVRRVMHDDPRPEIKFRRDQPSGQPIACALPVTDEAVFWKTGSSGFVGTGLEEHLRKSGITRLAIVGGVAAFCVNSTARSAANLGFDVLVPEDALIAFAMPSRFGGDIEAEVALEVTLSALHAGFGTVLPTSSVLNEVSASA
jgi:nicotinamidase-related amidase